MIQVHYKKFEIRNPKHEILSEFKLVSHRQSASRKGKFQNLNDQNAMHLTLNTHIQRVRVECYIRQSPLRSLSRRAKNLHLCLTCNVIQPVTAICYHLSYSEICNPESCNRASCIVLLIHNGRQLNGKGGTLAHCTLHIDRAFMFIDNAIHNGEAKAHPFACFFSGEKGIKDL